MKKILFLIFVIFVCTGCPLVPFIDSFKKMGATEVDRKNMLKKTVDSFHNKVLAGEFMHISDFILPESKDEVILGLRKNRKTEKIVETNIDLIDFDEDAKNAEVEVIVRYYKIPYFIVLDRIEKQEWTFVGVRSHWKLVRKTIIEGEE